MRRLIAVLLVMLAVGCSAARADEAGKRAKAQELFTLLRLDQTMGQVTASVMKQVQQITQAMPGADQATPEQKRLVADFQKRVLDLVTQKIGWKALEPDFITLYASTYTEEELDGIIGFYKSPAGQKMLDKNPELMAKSTALTREKMQELQPQLEQMAEDFMKQMAASAGKPAVAPAGPAAPTEKKP